MFFFAFFVINRADVVLFLEIIRDISGFFCLCDFDYKDIFIYPTTIVVIVILYHRHNLSCPSVLSILMLMLLHVTTILPLELITEL